MSALSNNIQLIRGLLNLTQDEFGKLVIPGEKKATSDPKQIKKIRSKVSSWENGVAQPPFAVLANISKAGGVTIDQLTSKQLNVSEIKIELNQPNNESDKSDKSDESINTTSAPLVEYLKQELESTKTELKYLIKENALLNRELEIMRSKSLDYASKRGRVG